MSDSDQGHRAVAKNGIDSAQNTKLRELELDDDQNKKDHRKIFAILEDVVSDIKARRMVRTGAIVFFLAFLPALGWFVTVTLQHAWRGEQWGHELERGIEENGQAIKDMRDLILEHQLNQTIHTPRREKDE